MESSTTYPFGSYHNGELESEFRRLLQAGTLARVTLPVDGDAWLACKYADVRTVLTDPRFSRAAATRPGVARLSPEILPTAALLAKDPPDHSRLRRTIASAFSARRVNGLLPAVESIAAQLFEGMRSAPTPFDLLNLCETLPLLTICHILGISPKDRALFTDRADVLTSRTASAAQIVAARRDVEFFLRDLITQRDDGEEDLVGDLVAAMGEGQLDSDELVNVLVALLVGGRGSPAVFLSTSVQILLSRPDRAAWNALAASDASADRCIEELLRYVPIGVAGGFVRVAVEDVSLNGTVVKAGEAVLPAMIAANRDPAIFEDPDELNPNREPNQHLAFGHGAHHCVGAQLSRMMARVFLTTLRRDFPSLRLAAPEPTWDRGRVVRRLSRLDVEWDSD